MQDFVLSPMHLLYFPVFAYFEDPVAKPHVLETIHILYISILATVGIALMWVVFWISVIRSKANVHDVLMSTGFFRTVTVIGVLSAVTVLSLAGRLEGNITGAILSGIVGYVLGQVSGRAPGANDGKKPPPPAPTP